MKKYRGKKSRDTAPLSCKLLCLRRQPRQMNKHPPVVQTPQRKSINNYNQRRHNPEAERFVQSPTQLLNLNFKAHISQLGEIVLHKEWLRCEKKLRSAFSWHCTFKLEPWWKGRRGLSGLTLFLFPWPPNNNVTAQQCCNRKANSASVSNFDLTWIQDKINVTKGIRKFTSKVNIPFLLRPSCFFYLQKATERKIYTLLEQFWADFAVYDW